jgi:pantoate--beta-alanine ligase
MPEAKLGYISLVSAENFESVTENFRGRALLLVAAVIGKTRLIDNIEINF